MFEDDDDLSAEIGYCANCGKPFRVTHSQQAQKFCSKECYEEVRRHYQRLPRESHLSELAAAAAECNLDYGTYRALLKAGKTHEELKAQAPNRQVGAHQRRMNGKAGIIWGRML